MSRTRRLPQSYRVQHGCHNCAHVFVKTEYDSEDEYYCTVNATPRPLCLSVGMEECPNTDWDGHFDRWHKWREGREVRAWAICDYWVP